MGADRRGGPQALDRRDIGHEPPGRRAGARRWRVKVDVAEGPLETVKADAIVVGVYAEEGRLRESAARIDKALGGQLAEILEAERFAGKPAHVTHVHTGGRIPAGRAGVVGLGKRAELTLETVRRAASAGGGRVPPPARRA